MSKHTPGPWITYVNKWPDKIVVRSMFPDGTECAQVAVTNSDNARLIAAAPELLEALKELTGHANERFSGGVWDRARAAIKQAEGENT